MQIPKKEFLLTNLFKNVYTVRKTFGFETFELDCFNFNVKRRIGTTLDYGWSS